MAGKKSKSLTCIPAGPVKWTGVARMLIRNEVSAETFLAAYGKKHSPNYTYPVGEQR